MNRRIANQSRQVTEKGRETDYFKSRNALHPECGDS